MEIKKALISVSDKTGLESFGKSLHESNVEIISTGGTYNFLEKNGIPVTGVERITGFPEILNGRVKTLHPKIFGGILGLRHDQAHLQEMEKHGIPPVDMVVCNLYPFQETVATPGITIDQALENIDIGGVTLIRAAAKNFPNVLVVVDGEDYPEIGKLINQHVKIPMSMRKQLAIKAFNHTASYDTAIKLYLESCDVN